MYRNSFQWKFECITHHHCEWIKKKPERSEAKLKSKSTTKRWQQINRISNALTWIWHWFISQMVFSLLFHGIFRTSCSYKCPTHLKNVRGNGKSGWVNVDSHETNRNRKKKHTRLHTIEKTHAFSTCALRYTANKSKFAGKTVAKYHMHCTTPRAICRATSSHFYSFTHLTAAAAAVAAASGCSMRKIKLSAFNSFHILPWEKPMKENIFQFSSTKIQ